MDNYYKFKFKPINPSYLIFPCSITGGSNECYLWIFFRIGDIYHLKFNESDATRKYDACLVVFYFILYIKFVRISNHM